jgi:hypothetical protein
MGGSSLSSNAIAFASSYPPLQVFEASMLGSCKVNLDKRPTHGWIPLLTSACFEQPDKNLRHVFPPFCIHPN